jgi:hypothetical protein
VEGEKMKKEYNSVQKKIDKLLWETSEKHTGKTYHEMIQDPEYQIVIQKIGELMRELENYNETDRKNVKQKKKGNT